MIKSERVYRWWEYLTECLGVDKSEVAEIGGYNLSHDDLRNWMDENGYDNYWDYPLSEIEHITDNKDDLQVVVVICNGVGKFWEVDYED